MAAVARQHGLNTNMLFNWRRQVQRADVVAVPASEAAGFVSVGVVGTELAPQPEAGGASKPGSRIEIELTNGVRLRVDASIETPALRRVLAALKDIR